jgi:hypothetical protein
VSADRFSLAVGALALIAVLACAHAVPSPAAAAGIVGNATPASCTETALDAALVLSFEHEFDGFDLPGTYFAYAGVALAGGSPFVAGNQLSVAIKPLLFTPSVPQ